jgi:hypothetical protein
MTQRSREDVIQKIVLARAHPADTQDQNAGFLPYLRLDGKVKQSTTHWKGSKDTTVRDDQDRPLLSRQRLQRPMNPICTRASKHIPTHARGE